MSPELEAALSAARAAGRLQRRRFRRNSAVELKADDTPVTAADRDSEVLIRRMLAGVIPGAGVLAEEGEAVVGVRALLDPAGVRERIPPELLGQLLEQLPERPGSLYACASDCSSRSAT